MVALKRNWRSMYGMFTSLGLHWEKDLSGRSFACSSGEYLGFIWVRIFMLGPFKRAGFDVGFFFQPVVFSAASGIRKHIAQHAFYQKVLFFAF